MVIKRGEYHLVLLLSIALIIMLTSCKSENTSGMAVSDLSENTSEDANETEIGQSDALTSKFNKLVMGVEETVEPQKEEVKKEPEQVPPEEPALEEEVIEINTTQELAHENKSAPAPLVISEPNTIIMKNSAFRPETLKIKEGTKVTWKNDDTKMHILNMFLGDAFDENPRLDPGESYEYTFENDGTFKYQDVILLDKMRGTIIVEVSS